MQVNQGSMGMGAAQLQGRGMVPSSQQQQQTPHGTPLMPTTSTKRQVTATEIHNTQPGAEIFRQYKKHKPTDRALPTTLLAHDAGLVELSQEYEKLLDYEKNLDSLYARKKVELMEDSGAMKRTAHKRLRVRISNTCSDQDWQEGQETTGKAEEGEDGVEQKTERPDFETGKGVPSWTVRIEAKLLDLEGATPSPESEQESLPRFSQIVQHMSIDIHRPEGAYREPALLNWQPKSNLLPADGFSFTRSGTDPHSMTISLYLSQQPRRYKVAPELGDLLDLREDTKMGILSALWAYIQKERLLEIPSAAVAAGNDDRRNIRCDEKLQRLFNVPRIPFYQLFEGISRFLSPPDPVKLEYKVDVTAACETSASTYDIFLEIPDPSLRSSASILRSLAATAPASQEVMKLDEQLADSISSIRNLAYQHSLLSKFSDNPVTFMREWMESQSYDLETLLNPSSTTGRGYEGEWRVERMRDADWFQSDAVKDAVSLYIARLQANPKQ